MLQKRIEGPAQPAKHKQAHAPELLVALSVVRDGGALQGCNSTRQAEAAAVQTTSDQTGRLHPQPRASRRAPDSCGRRWSCLLFFFQSSGGWRGGAEAALGARAGASRHTGRIRHERTEHGSSLRGLAPLHCASAVVLLLSTGKLY